MLDNIQAKQIWFKLVEQNYQIKSITIEIETFRMTNTNIEVIFTDIVDLHNFNQLIFDQMYIDILSGNGGKRLMLYFDFDFDFLKKATYPKFTEQIYIYNKFKSDNILSFGVLPCNLKKLQIISSTPFDLTNLPNISTLMLSGHTGKKKFNLDYLPSSIKLLDLSYPSSNENNIYNLEDFCNLPNGLEQIFIQDKHFNSVQELLEKYNWIFFK